MRPVFPALWLSMRGVWSLLAIALVLAVSSVVPVLLYAVAVAALGLGALLIADAVAGPSARSLRVVRRPLPPLALRRTASVTYDVENRALLPIRVGVVETPVPTIVFAGAVVIARVPPRTATVATLAFEPRERGRVGFGALYVWTENRIGLLRRRYRSENADEARVFPDLGAVAGYGTLAKRSTLVDAGLRRLRQRGAGREFESLREYAPGDGFGLIDWKATARRGRTMVAQYAVERSQAVIVALDCGRLMTPRIGPQLKFDYALEAALSVARVAQAADDNIGLLAFAAKPIVEIAPRRGAAHLRALANIAYDLQPRFEEPDYETIFAELRRRYTKRSLIILFTDIIDPITSAAVLAGLQTLVPRHLVVCVLLNDVALAAALERSPSSPTDAYRTAVAMTLADERARSVAILRSRGIIVIDVPAPRLTLALVDAYLDVKARGRL